MPPLRFPRFYATLAAFPSPSEKRCPSTETRGLACRRLLCLSRGTSPLFPQSSSERQEGLIFHCRPKSLHTRGLQLSHVPCLSALASADHTTSHHRHDAKEQCRLG